MNKVERLKAKVRNMTKEGKTVAKNLLHSAETLAVGAGGAYAEGRMSDETGEWGYKNVPYLYMGGGVLFLLGFFGGPRYGADLMAAGTGAVGGHLFRSMYETGVESKNTTTQGRRRIGSKVPMGLDSAARNVPPATAQKQTYGTALDALRGAR